MSFGASSFGLAPYGLAPLAADGGGPVTFRPASDDLTTGWASTAATLAGAIDEATVDDADYITSPDVAATPGPARMSLTSSMAAGSYTATVRARKTATSGELRVVLLDASNASVGASAWQALTGSLTTYSLSVTASDMATKCQIEVRA